MPKYTPPAAVECEACKGLGRTEHIFRWLDCLVCEGTGRLSAETGEPLSKYEACQVLLDEGRKKDFSIMNLKKRIKDGETDPYSGMKGNLRLD
ncbi:hypothetical protein [Neptuniibacter sp.]|uniref:hypothetical protein n=1 Tax=Neptuniibacter sp. TaxID=1962643 RepID=UPI00262D8DB2|nr:hypothetical protein [Neptuniibacter sp.]MCP4596175.1 hypothetical protein [Neptuniibacter sp.]